MTALERYARIDAAANKLRVELDAITPKHLMVPGSSELAAVVAAAHAEAWAWGDREAKEEDAHSWQALLDGELEKLAKNDVGEVPE